MLALRRVEAPWHAQVALGGFEYIHLAVSAVSWSVGGMNLLGRMTGHQVKYNGEFEWLTSNHCMAAGPWKEESPIYQAFRVL